jgi:hypothetical protein
MKRKGSRAQGGQVTQDENVGAPTFKVLLEGLFNSY